MKLQGQIASATVSSLPGPLGALEGQIRALCRNGQLHTALHLLSGVPTALADDVYRVLLHSCAKKKALSQAKQIRAHLFYHSPSLSTLLYEHLVLTFAKCGALEDACDVLHACPCRTTFSWTALICGCVEYGRPEEALHFYKCMKDDGVEPNHYTFVSLFRACGSMVDIKEGTKLHEDAKNMGFLSNVYVVNSLVSMYGNCHSISGAEDVFQSGDAQLDLVSWNAMLSAYVELEEGDKALRLFRQMQEEGVSPDGRTFIPTLLACRQQKEQDEGFKEEFIFEVGQTLHADARKKGIYSNDFFLSALVNMYGQCKAIARAENVFCSIHSPDIVQWNAMLTAYSEVGHGIKILQVFLHMNKQGISPDQYTFVIALQACRVLAEEGIACTEFARTKLMALEIGEALRFDAWKQGYSSNVFLNTALISLYGRCGIIEKAKSRFDQIDKTRTSSWNAMLSVYAEQGEGEKALQLYSAMQKEGVSPDHVTFMVAIQACCIMARRENVGELETSISLEIGKGLHIDAQKESLDTNYFVGSSLIHMYGKCGLITDAEEVFGRLSQRNVISWNALISASVEQGEIYKTLDLFRQMQEKGITMNDSTFISVLQASNISSLAELCKKVHFILLTEGYDAHSLLLTTLTHAYGNCALVADAEAVFSGISQYDVVSCSVYLDALLQNGASVACLQLFEFMRWVGLEPDGVTFYVVLSGCSHAGVVDVGVQCFELMIKHFCIRPEFRHYAIMMDLLGRAGNFVRLQKILATIQPDLHMWSSLLGVCRLHGNVEIGKWAFDHIVRLKPKEASAYILMWNIFADAGMQDSARQIDLLRQSHGLEKVCMECDEI